MISPDARKRRIDLLGFFHRLAVLQHNLAHCLEHVAPELEYFCHSLGVHLPAAHHPHHAHARSPHLPAHHPGHHGHHSHAAAHPTRPANPWTHHPHHSLTHHRLLSGGRLLRPPLLLLSRRINGSRQNHHYQNRGRGGHRFHAKPLLWRKNVH